MIGKLLFVLAFSCLAAKQSICLNMIVKDEQSIIAKNLASAKQIIDYWVIVDTGSTDGTQEEIRRCMQGVPGELHERPWVDFEHNRNEALALARGKKLHDKRETIKDRDWKREQGRLMRERG